MYLVEIKFSACTDFLHAQGYIERFTTLREAKQYARYARRMGDVESITIIEPQ